MSVPEGWVVVMVTGLLTILIWPRVLSYNKMLENKKKIKRKREEVKTRKIALEDRCEIHF